MKRISKSKKAMRMAHADQGDFFFADLLDANGCNNPHPILIIGRNDDSNDFLDVLACPCTSKQSRSSYDVPVFLNKPSVVRTNKIQTVPREKLRFQIEHSLQPEDLEKIIELAISAIRHKAERPLVTTATAVSTATTQTE